MGIAAGWIWPVVLPFQHLTRSKMAVARTVQRNYLQKNVGNDFYCTINIGRVFSAAIKYLNEMHDATLFVECRCLYAEQ